MHKISGIYLLQKFQSSWTSPFQINSIPRLSGCLNLFGCTGGTFHRNGCMVKQLAQDFFLQQLMEKISYHYWISESFEIDSLVLLKWSLACQHKTALKFLRNLELWQPWGMQRQSQWSNPSRSSYFAVPTAAQSEVVFEGGCAIFCVHWGATSD